MANTTLMKTLVEPFVREQLEHEYGQPFSQRFLPLPGGGLHEFDAVSDDGTVVTSIKSNSGLTSGGRRPGGKILACYAELYYLAQVDSPSRHLVLTNPDFFEIFERDSRGKLVPGVSLKLIALPVALQSQVTEITAAASREMAGGKEPAPEVAEVAELAISGELQLEERAKLGCREEILGAITTITRGSQKNTFTLDQVIREMERRGSGYAENTIRTHVTSKMCANAPNHHASVYEDLERVGRGLYRLRGG